MKLRVTCSAEDLASNDTYFAVLTLHEGSKGTKPIVLGQTEVLTSTRSPDFTKSFLIDDYEIHQETHLIVSLYRGKNVTVGSTLFEIGQVLGHAGSLAKELKSSGGVVAVHIEQVSGTAGQLQLHLRGLGLKNVDGLGFKLNVSDPFFELQRARLTTAGKSVWDAVYRSETLDNNLNPVFPEFFIDLEDLLGTTAASSPVTAKDTKFRMAVYDWEKSGKHQVIGTCVVSVNDLIDNVNDTALQDIAKIDLNKAFPLKDDKNKESGKILIFKANVSGAAVAEPLAAALLTAPVEATASSVPKAEEPVVSVAPVPETVALLPEPVLVDAAPAETPSAPTPAGPSAPTPPTGPSAPTPPTGPSAPTPPTAPTLSISQPADVPVETEVVLTATSTDDLVPVDAGDLGGLRPTFCNYIAGGCQLRVSVAIDATASNGDPRQESSLHYFCGEGHNNYESALEAICTVLSKYDSDGTYNVWGFGAKRNDVVDHCFPFSSNPSNEVDGVAGILQAYRETFRSGLVMSSPRDFAPAIHMTGTNAKKESGEAQSYSVLLIFTSGSPLDSAATLAALKEANDAPLSVILVGIGKEEELTGTKALVDAHKAGGRDNLNFVFYQSGQDSESFKQGALHSIPSQLESFFASKEILPSPASDDVVVVPYSPDDDIHVPLEINEQTGEVTVGGDVTIPESKPGAAPSSTSSTFSELKKFGKKLKSNKTVGRIRKKLDAKTINMAKGKINRFIGKKLF